MESKINITDQMEEIIATIKGKNEEIMKLNQEINNMVSILEEKMRTIKNLQKTPETVVSRLVNMPVINPIITNPPMIAPIATAITMTDRVRYPKEFVEAFEQISKFYDYKSSNTIIRNGKFGKYPRYICKEGANSTIVRNLLIHGFIDKIMVDETLTSIATLPPLIVQSVEAYMKSFGPGGIYGIQVFNASTDLEGKPILLCQIFRSGKHSIIDGESTSLKTPVPCNLEGFKRWLCQKRAVGLATLKTRLEELIKNPRVCVIGNTTGGTGETEETVTIYYNNDVILHADKSALTGMHTRISGLHHKHAKETLEAYNNITGQKRSPVITLKGPANPEGECSNPF